MSSERLFTPRFFVMCGFTFTVFLSAFQLLPTAPFHILDLGGSTFASGLFLGFLTFSSAFSAPLTGAFADRIGQRRILIVSSLALAVFSVIYALLKDFRLLLALALVHGVFWSGLLSASAAYMTNMLPEKRRAEGIGYWGLSTLAAVSIAPTVGFWIYHQGWLWLCICAAVLNLVMAGIAWGLKEHPRIVPHDQALDGGGIIERRVLIVSVTLALYSFGYGGITSFAAMYADANGVTPKGLYLTALAIVILLTRPILGPLGDTWGYKRIFIPCLILISCGMACLYFGGTRTWLLVSAVVFGIGFGTAYPSYVGYVMRGVLSHRRGAAFGAILAAFDTGIGTGSTVMGWLIERHGFANAFGAAAALSALALPYFLMVDRWYGAAE
jgi:MFS family permease